MRWQWLIYPLFSTVAFYLAFTLPLPYLYGLGGITLLSLDFLLQLLLGIGLFAVSIATSMCYATAPPGAGRPDRRGGGPQPPCSARTSRAIAMPG